MAAHKNKSNLIEFDLDAIKAREEAVTEETDQQIIDRLALRFTIVDDMTRAIKNNDIRAMILSGPPGVGKSHSVEQILEKDAIFDKLADFKPKFEIVKGALSSIGLYIKLYEFSEPNNVLVFDDCDSIFYDALSLNILKAALDTSDRRWISWNTDSRILRSEGVPDRFEFKAGVIFITNIKFANVRSKTLKEHLAALESRCHYIDLEMDTPREKLLRIKQVIAAGMLDKYDFEPEAKQSVIDFVLNNVDSLHELSLRTLIKTADLRRAFPACWEAMAKTTLLKKA